MCRSFCMGGYRGKTALFLFFLLPPCTLHSRSAKSGGPVKVRSSACGKVVDEWLTLSCAVSSFQTSALPSCRKYSLLPRKRTNLSFCFLYATLLQFFFIILNPIFWFFFLHCFYSSNFLRICFRRECNNMSATLLSGYFNTRETKSCYIYFCICGKEKCPSACACLRMCICAYARVRV